MSSLEIRCNALYCCKWRARELRRQFPQWPLGSSTTHFHRCSEVLPEDQTTLQHTAAAAAAGESTPSLRKPLFNSSLSPSLPLSCYFPLFIHHSTIPRFYILSSLSSSSFSSVSCIPSPGVSLCDMNMYSNTCFRCWCYALNTLRVQNPPRWYLSHRLMHSF